MPELEGYNNNLKNRLFGLLCEYEKDREWETFLDSILIELMSYPEEQKTAEIRIQRDHRLAVRWADQTSSKGNAAAGEEGAGFFKENIQFRSWKSFRSYQERTGNYRKAVHKAGRSHGYGSTGCHFSGGCI